MLGDCQKMSEARAAAGMVLVLVACNIMLPEWKGLRFCFYNHITTVGYRSTVTSMCWWWSCVLEAVSTQCWISRKTALGWLRKSSSECYKMLVCTSTATTGAFQNAYEFVNLGTLKFSTLYKNRIFQCMGNIFRVEFQRYPLKFNTKYLTHTLTGV